MYTHEIWNKKKDINNVTAEKAMEIHGITGDDIVGLIKNDAGKVIVFQYFKNKKITKDEMLDWLKEKTEEMNNPPESEDIAD